METCRAVEHEGSHRQSLTDDRPSEQSILAIEYKNPTPEFLISSILSHQALSSAYANYESISPKPVRNPDWSRELWCGEPQYTNFAEWKGTLDYIFYFGGIDILAIKEIPQAEELGPWLPNGVYGSDHVFLLAQLNVDG